jgi:hypothetical protein
MASIHHKKIMNMNQNVKTPISRDLMLNSAKFAIINRAGGLINLSHFEGGKSARKHLLESYFKGNTGGNSFLGFFPGEEHDEYEKMYFFASHLMHQARQKVPVLFIAKRPETYPVFGWKMEAIRTGTQESYEDNKGQKFFAHVGDGSLSDCRPNDLEEIFKGLVGPFLRNDGKDLPPSQFFTELILKNGYATLANKNLHFERHDGFQKWRNLEYPLQQISTPPTL